MYTAFSVLIFVFLVALAATYVPLASRRWVIFRLTAAGLYAVAGFVCALVAYFRFSSIETYNEWAADAFSSFIRPLEIMTVAGVIILAASVLTSKTRLKTVICLSAAAAAALFVLLYTALFGLMTDGTSHPVNTYILVCGGASAAIFAAVAAVAEIRRFFKRDFTPHTIGNPDP